MTTKHDASASAIGYLYQCRYALLLGLRATKDAPNLEISIERFDDIAFSQSGEPKELIQTKHHSGTQRHLGDASPDIWKTFHIWIKRVAADVDLPSRTRFVIITNVAAPAGSAASLLRLDERDTLQAEKLMLEVANTSTNKAHEAAYAAYKALPSALRQSLLRAVIVLDQSPNIVDTREDIAREVRRAVDRDKVDSFVERLEGWWFANVINALSDPNSPAIPVLAIETRIDELREDFKRSSLPVDYKSVSPPADVVAALDKRVFVKQLRDIAIGPSRIEYAIRDYYRASEQRSKWAREDLLVGGELAAYEQDLVEAWQPRFVTQKDELASSATKDEKIKAAQALYKWVELDANYPLRSLREKFLTNGSYHILANRLAVGWHPEYELNCSSAESDEAKE